METPTIVKQTKEYVIVKIPFPRNKKVHALTAGKSSARTKTDAQTKQKQPSK